MLLTHHPERRRTTRVRRSLLAHDRTGAKAIARRVIDVCQDGMRLALTPAYAAGAILELDLYLGNRPEPLRLRGEVVTTRGDEAGIRFLGLSTRDRVRLLEALFGDDEAN